MSTVKRTLYANKTHDRFFYIPQDAEIPEGTFEIGTLTGHMLQVTESAVSEFEVDETLAKDIASGVVKDVAQTAGRFMTSAADFIRSMSTGELSEADMERRQTRQSNVAEFLGVTRDQLQNDPEAVMEGIKSIGRGLKASLEQSIADNPVSQESAKARMDAFAQYAKEDLGIKLGDNPAELPKQLADILRNPELEASVRASTERLRNLATQIRSASATVEEMERTAAAEDALDEE
jgi:hypothetical protein